MNDITSAVQGFFRSISLEALVHTVILLLIALAVVRLLLNVAGRILSRSHLDERMRKIVLRAGKVVLYLITAIVVITNLGVDITSLVALLSVLSLGVTLAAEDVLGNMAGGLVIFASHPFALGDYIEVSGAAGTVDEITLNYTKLVTPDGHLVMLPNKTMAESQMINYTALGRRRVTQVICAAGSAPTETVRAACLPAVAATENVLEDPPPMVVLSGYKTGSIEYTVYCWTEPAHYFASRCALAEHLRDAFAQAGVEITCERLNVHIRQD